MRITFVIIILAIAGCETPTLTFVSPADSPQPINIGERFDPTTCGTLTGTVTWTGAVPDAMPFVRNTSIIQREVISNPNALTVTDGKLAGAVVMLKGIDPARSKPWHHDPVTVELHDRGFTVHQGIRKSGIGFVRVNDSVRFHLNSEAVVGVRGRGDAFFGHILTKKQQDVNETFSKVGQVRLSSASGQFWTAAELFVCDHPYYAITDTEGRFEFTEVPNGQYEVITMHPNPTVIARECDPETSLQVRQTYGTPFRATTPVTIRSRTNATATIALKP